MKKLFLLILPIIFIFSNCNKYEDGPAFSLNTKTHRLANVWMLDKVYETQNGVTTDKTSDYEAYYYSFVLTMDKKNLYSLSYAALNILAYEESGTWVWSGDKTHIYFTKTSSSSATGWGSDWTILKLKEKELWGSFVQSNGTVVEIHFIPRFK